MGDSLSLGRVAGIRVGVNWSVLVLLVLLVWTLAAVVFPGADPGLGSAGYLTMAGVAAALFLGSILLHELGHALQARREGMEIDGITLWLFGGVARFAGMFPSAGAEFRIAVAGPVVSLLLGLGFLGASLAPGLPAPAETVAAWLGVINLLLLAFNLLPALPLDGGRVLRSALWRWRGDFARATRLAGAAARGLSYLMIAAGLAALLVVGAFSGAWLAFIGWFLLQASTAETRAALAREALEGLRVRDLMVSEPVTASPDLSLGDFMDLTVWTHRHRAYPVVEDGRPVGIMPFGRVAQVPREEWGARRVGELMIARADAAVVDADEVVADALPRLQQDDLHRALVIEGERLVGLLSITDVARVIRSPEGRRAGGPRPP